MIFFQTCCNETAVTVINLIKLVIVSLKAAKQVTQKFTGHKMKLKIFMSMSALVYKASFEFKKDYSIKY